MNDTDRAPRTDEDRAMIEIARELYVTGSDGDIDIDSNAAVSYGEQGAYVAAWVFVPNDDGGEVDTSSSASRQHYIDTGRYLRPGEALELDDDPDRTKDLNGEWT